MRKATIGLVRWIVGAVFLYSGFVKSVDAWGLAFKLEEYFEVFHITFLNPLAPYLSIAFNTLEMALGAAIITGFMPVLTTGLLLALILFFSFLTGYSAAFDVVKDCGCFGDAIKLTPAQSFAKDVVLLLLILYLWRQRHRIRPLAGKRWATYLTLIVAAAALAMNYYSYRCDAIIDFRPYKTGNNIAQLMEIPEGAPVDEYHTTVIYRNRRTNETKAFEPDALPTDTVWEWVETRNVLVKEGYKPPIHDFVISSADGQDHTQAFLEDAGWKLLIVMRDLAPLRSATVKKIRALVVGMAGLNGQPVKIWAVTGATPDEVAAFRKKYQALFDIYFMDRTTLKTITRANPGVLLLKGAEIRAKWSACHFPDISDVLEVMNAEG